MTTSPSPTDASRTAASTKDASPASASPLDAAQVPEVRRFATALVIAASTMLFAGLLGGFLVLAESRRPDIDPEVRLPAPFGLGVLAIIVSSLALGLSGAQRRRSRRSTRATASLVPRGRAWWDTATVLGALFLVLQTLAALHWWNSGALPSTLNWRGAVYLLAGLHAAHAIAGLIWLIRERGRWKDEGAHGACEVYWHFVGVVWLVVIGFLWEGGW